MGMPAGLATACSLRAEHVQRLLQATPSALLLLSPAPALLVATAACHAWQLVRSRSHSCRAAKLHPALHHFLPHRQAAPSTAITSCHTHPAAPAPPAPAGRRRPWPTGPAGWCCATRSADGLVGRLVGKELAWQSGTWTVRMTRFRSSSSAADAGPCREALQTLRHNTAAGTASSKPKVQQPTTARTCGCTLVSFTKSCKLFLPFFLPPPPAVLLPPPLAALLPAAPPPRDGAAEGSAGNASAELGGGAAGETTAAAVGAAVGAGAGAGRAAAAQPLLGASAAGAGAARGAAAVAAAPAAPC